MRPILISQQLVEVVDLMNALDVFSYGAMRESERTYLM